MAGEGREGDWECGECRNRNYAFRSFCNRCKQPRLLVDTKTPADSKWLPRVGDWICSGCTNNNYASREKCKKCGQPKEVAAMPAFPMSGVFARSRGSLQHNLNIGILGNNPFHHPYSGSMSWLGMGTHRFGYEPSPAWSSSRNDGNFNLFANVNDQTPGAPKGWRNGDWICGCGFHNYSSRAQCKQCGTAQPALGIKRLASDDLVDDYDNKRLNAGPATSPYMQSFRGSAKMSGYTTGNSALGSNNIQLPQLVTAPALIGKGAKHWRDGDWVCTQCNNHNYASRMQCNRCQTKRPETPQNGDDDGVAY